MKQAGSSNCGCKLGRNSAKYGVANLTSTVRHRREEDGLSLRDLADFVNTRFLGAALADTDADIAGDAVSVYETLTGEEVSPERRQSLRNRLVDLGISLGELEEDFVSYQTVRYHLQNCLGTDTGRDGITSVSEGRAVIASTLERDREIVTQSLRRLQRVGGLRDTEIQVRLAPRVSCHECGESYGLEEFLDTGGCDCAM